MYTHSTSRNVRMAQLLIDLHGIYDIDRFGGAMIGELLADARVIVDDFHNAGGPSGNPNPPPFPPGSPLGQGQLPPAPPLNDQTGQSQYPSGPLAKSPHPSTYLPLPINSQPGAMQDRPPPSNDTPGAMRSLPLLSNDPPSQMQNQHTSALPSNSPAGTLLRCFPPGLQLGHIGTDGDRLDDKDQHWCYKCDWCGHPVRFRSNFNRHAK